MPRGTAPSIPSPTDRYLRFDHPEAFCSTVSTIYRPVVLESLPRGVFSGGIESHQSGDLLVSHVDATSHEFRHDVPDPADVTDNEPIKVFTPLNGAAVLRQGNHEVTLEPGGLGVVDTSQTYRILGDSGFDCLILMLPRSRVHLTRPELAELTATHLAGGGLEGVVVPYLTGLAHNLTVLSGAGGQRVALSTVDLLSTILRAQIGPQLSTTQSRHADLLDRAKIYIAENLGDRSLSPATIAAALFVSPRHVHALFTGAQTTVSAYVRAQRLDRARRDLTDPSLTHLSIADIAAHWAFADGAHFTRTFKEAFDMTPSELRRGSGTAKSR